MAVSNTVVHQLYQGTGAQTSFAIPCAIIPSLASSIIKVFTVDADGLLDLQVEGALQDYTLTPAYNPITNPNGPANVVFNVAPAALLKVLVTRELPLTQVTNFIATGYYRAESTEQSLDRATFLIQQLGDTLARVPKGSFLNASAFDWNLPSFDPAGEGFGILVRNEDNTAFQWMTPAEILSEALLEGGGGGVPPGGVEGDVLVAGAVDGEGVWESYAYSGFSPTLGNVNFATLKEIIDDYIGIQYSPPQISLSASGSGTVREKGVPLASTTLTANVTKLTDDIAEVRFYRSPSTLLDTKTGTIPGGGSENTVYATPFSDSASFYAQVDDDGTDPAGPTTVTSNTVGFTFVYPYYFGVGAAGLTPSQVAALTKDVRVSTSSLLKSFVASGSNYPYFAYPLAYGALTSIKDDNLFEVLSSFTQSTISITGPDGTPQSYYQYRLTNLPTAGTYGFTFIR